MAQIPFVDLLPEVLATAPACPMPTIIRAMRNAARDLCERSKCYRYRLEPESVSLNDPEVELTLPPFTVMVAPISLSLDGHVLTPTSASLLEEDHPNWAMDKGHPRFYLRSTLDLNSVRVYPTPESAFVGNHGLQGEVALKPSLAATGLEEMVLDKYQTPLVSGTLANLLMIASAGWYNPIQAAYHAEIFEDGITKAAARAAGDDLPKRRIARYGGL